MEMASESQMSEDPFRPFGVATREEIQRAHDMLCAIVRGEVGQDLLPNTQACAHLAHDVLAWVLGFKGGETFRGVISLIAHQFKN